MTGGTTSSEGTSGMGYLMPGEKDMRSTRSNQKRCVKTAIVDKLKDWRDGDVGQVNE